MSKSDFQDLITESVNACFKRQCPQQIEESNNEGEDLLNIQQAAALISLSVPTVYGLVSRANIPAFKKGKRLYFSKQELLAWVKEGRKKTFADIESETDAFLQKQKNKKG